MSANQPRALSLEIPRPRLHKALAALRDVKLVALLAPSGYGKTTLLAQYVRMQRLVTVWVRLGPDDASVGAFVEHLAFEVSQSSPDLILTHWQRERAARLPAEGLARALLRDLNVAPAELCIVFDEVQHLSAEAGRLLERFVQGLARQHRVLLAGFDPCPVPLARLLAAGDAAVLGLEVLRFSPAETRALLKAAHGTGDALSITRALEGWCAGVALAVVSERVSATPQRLIEECLDRLAEPLRSRLPEASIADLWSEAIFAELGVSLPTGWVRDALEIGLPLLPLEADVYRPHDVLREVLETRLKGNPSRHAALHRMAGQREWEAGRPLGAIRHFQQAGNTDQAFAVAAEAVAPLAERSEFGLVRELLEPFEERTMPLHVKLRWAQALMETGDAPRADVLLRALYAAGQRDPFMLYQLAILEYRQGRHEAQLARVAEGLTMQPDPRTIARLRFIESAGLEALGRFEEGLGAALEANRIADELNDLPLLASTFTVLGSSYAELGQRLECERSFRRAIDLCERLAMDQRLLPNFNNLANHLSDWGRMLEALPLLERGLAIAERDPNLWLPILLGTRGLQFLRLRRISEAIRDLERGLGFCAQYDLQVPSFNYRLWLADALQCNGQLEEAQALLTENRGSSLASDPFFASQLAFYAGICGYAADDRVAATEQFMQVTEIAHLSWWDQPRWLAYQAALALESGALERAQIEALCERLQALGHDAPLLMDRSALRELWQACVERGWHTERFQRLLSPLEIASSPQVERVRLHLTTLGSTRFTVSGEELRLPLAKSVELLVWLAIHGAGRRDEIIADLWDGQRGGAAVQYFKEALRQLRLALKRHGSVKVDPVPFEADAYRLHEMFAIEVDVVLWLTPLVKADAAPASTEFLPALSSHWVLETRQRVQDAVGTWHVHEAQRLVDTEPLAAMPHFISALELDGLNAAALEGLKCLHRLFGDKHEVALAARLADNRLRRELESPQSMVFDA